MNFKELLFCHCFQVFTMIFVDADEALTDDVSPLHLYMNGLSTKTPYPTTVSLPTGSRGNRVLGKGFFFPSSGDRTVPQWPSHCTVTTGSE